jgi:sugar phosphate isomerase/epimerase
MNHLGLDYFTLFGAHPIHFIETAAAVGCEHVSLLLAQTDVSPPGSPPFSLLEDAQLRRDTLSCLAGHDVSIGLIDGFLVAPDRSVIEHRPSFEVVAELGVTRVNTVSYDGWERTVDETAALVAMAAEYDIMVTVEPCPVLTVKSVAQGLELIEKVALSNFKLLVDTMHVSRSGEATLVATMDPSLIDYVQICDAPLAMPATPEEYIYEAMNERVVPGEGELPLVDIMRNVRPEVIVSVETPLRSRLEAGMSDVERARLVVEGARRVLAQTGDGLRRAP